MTWSRRGLLTFGLGTASPAAAPVARDVPADVVERAARFREERARRPRAHHDVPDCVAAVIAWQHDPPPPETTDPHRSAYIDDARCLNAIGTTCSVCVERCPVPGALRLDARTAVVDPLTCTGCGVCAQVCPAPGRAVLLVPHEEPTR